jgi:hypothetical protein
MPSASGTSILQDDGSETLDEAGNVLVSAGDSDCDCCGGGGDDGNTDPCDVACCPQIYTHQLSVDAGYSLVGDILDIASGGGGVGDINHNVSCGDGVTTRLGGAGTKWQYVFGGQTYQTVATDQRCPPVGSALYWTKTAGGLYVLSYFRCYEPSTADGSLPSAILITGWGNKLQPNSSDMYPIGSGANYAFWDGILVKTGTAHYETNDGLPRTILAMDGVNYIDIVPFANYSHLSTIPDVGAMEVNINSTAGYFTLRWNSEGASWQGMMGLAQAQNTTGLRLQVPIELGAT